MKALVLVGKAEGVVYMPHYAQPTLAQGQVLVKMQAAALNHRDIWIAQGKYAGIVYPTILGSDGVGEVVQVADNAAADWLGKRVIINPNTHWGDSPKAQSRAYAVLGLPQNGTLAEYVAVATDRLHLAPDTLNTAQAAALPLAGMTAYRALFVRAAAQRGERVLINGIGGGVALMAMQLALAAGCEVYVTSSNDQKIARAIAIGATGGANYTGLGWQKDFVRTHGEMDVVIDSAGGNGFAALIDTLGAGGRLALYGGGNGLISDLSPQKIFWKQLSILGSTMATDAEFADMLAFVQQHHILPIIDQIFTLPNGKAAFEYMDSGAQFGKIVVTMDV